MGSIYFENGDYVKALEYYDEGLALRRESLDKLGEAGSLDHIGFTHFKLRNYAPALSCCKQSLDIARSTGDKRAQSNALLHLAEIYKETGEVEKAKQLSSEGLAIKKEIGDRRGEVEMLLFLAGLNKTNSGKQASHAFFNNALDIAEELKMLDLLSRIRFQLAGHYREQGNYEEALKHLELHISLEKEFHKNAITQKVLNLEISHKVEEAHKEATVIRLKNEELLKLNAEIEAQRNMLEQTLADLKATQAHLVQAEKMASLGELTAGIAHVIQNL